MAGRFTKQQWDKIEAELLRDPEGYGMPVGPREESMVLASFNIRKLGKVKNRERELAFMARFCARCDLVAIQEVQDSLDGLRHLKKQVDERVASEGEFGLVVSDITGEVPGEKGMAERLAFLYRKSRVRRMDMASDLSIDRSGVLNNFSKKADDFSAAWKKYNNALKKFQQTKKGKKPKLELPAFLTFTRTPFVSAFEVPATGDGEPLLFIAVNTHLVYGTMKDRKEEFKALVSWLTARLKKESKMVAPNFILLGDLNLDLDKPEKDRPVIENFIRSLNKKTFGDANARHIYFPFIGDHPRTGKPIRTNARLNQTFDQIAFFLGKQEKRLPNDIWWKEIVKDSPDTFDCGVFNFADLFAKVIKGKSFEKMTKAEVKGLGKHFEHSVSDHMPIWVRIPRPGFRPPPRG
ncbi:MAG: endonuclease/exonuclease/phosphatase [Rhodospirillales bacterium]|nr:endonuclease/exonuclease/phosphatase [Rhodospirillales bacterium]